MTSGGREARVRAGTREGVEVSGEDRAEVRVDRGGRRPLVLAELGRDLMGGDDVGVGMPATKLGRDRLLVPPVPKREEETDGDRLRVQLRQRCEIERLQLAVPPDATAYADRAFERDERLRMLRAGPVEMGAGLASQVEDVLEARRAHEGGPRAAPFEQRVRGDRGPVREAIHRLRADLPSGCQHRLLLMLSRGHLRRSHLAVRDEYGVGEGPADVDPERAHRRILCEPAQ